MPSVMKCQLVSTILACHFGLASAFLGGTLPHQPLLQLSAKKSATFGMGCFWAPSERLLQTEGVLDTVAGYTGSPNAQKAPTYESVCFGRQWVEGVRVEYDDTKVSYQELVDAFFEAQQPQLGSRQYASIIFPHDKEQEQVATEWLEKGKREQKKRRDGIPVEITQVEPLSPFFRAEGYHQNYWQKFRPRIAAGVVLLILSSGSLDSFIPPDLQSTLHTAANGAILLGCAYVVLERSIDNKVVELPP